MGNLLLAGVFFLNFFAFAEDPSHFQNSDDNNGFCSSWLDPTLINRMSDGLRKRFVAVQDARLNLEERMPVILKTNDAFYSSLLEALDQMPYKELLKLKLNPQTHEFYAELRRLDLVNLLRRKTIPSGYLVHLAKLGLFQETKEAFLTLEAIQEKFKNTFGKDPGVSKIKFLNGLFYIEVSGDPTNSFTRRFPKTFLGLPIFVYREFSLIKTEPIKESLSPDIRGKVSRRLFEELSSKLENSPSSNTSILVRVRSKAAYERFLAELSIFQKIKLSFHNLWQKPEIGLFFIEGSLKNILLILSSKTVDWADLSSNFSMLVANEKSGGTPEQLGLGEPVSKAELSRVQALLKELRFRFENLSGVYDIYFVGHTKSFFIFVDHEQLNSTEVKIPKGINGYPIEQVNRLDPVLKEAAEEDSTAKLTVSVRFKGKDGQRFLKSGQIKGHDLDRLLNDPSVTHIQFDYIGPFELNPQVLRKATNALRTQINETLPMTELNVLLEFKNASPSQLSAVLNVLKKKHSIQIKYSRAKKGDRPWAIVRLKRYRLSKLLSETWIEKADTAELFKEGRF